MAGVPVTLLLRISIPKFNNMVQAANILNIHLCLESPPGSVLGQLTLDSHIMVLHFFLESSSRSLLVQQFYGSSYNYINLIL